QGRVSRAATQLAVMLQKRGERGGRRGLEGPGSGGRPEVGKGRAARECLSLARDASAGPQGMGSGRALVLPCSSHPRGSERQGGRSPAFSPDGNRCPGAGPMERCRKLV